MNSLHYSQYSHHEGISCDHCLKSNFRGKRFKCLVCPDYDLCSSCYESGTVPAGKRHTSEHPVQCILTRNDYEVYFGGETTPIEQIQSFTCPICGKMGFTENLLYDHSVQEHSDTFTEVSCPICCSTQQNVELSALTIEDFTSHLSVEHRSGRGYDTPQALRGRRVPHSNRAGGVNQSRNRRQITPNTVTMLSNINPLLSSLPHDQTTAGSNSQIRDLDPITELLSQLRRTQNPNQSSLSSNSFSNANPLHLHLDRNNFRGNTLRQVFERPAEIVVRRHNQASLNPQTISQSNLSSNGASLSSYLLMDTSNNQLTSTSGQPVTNSNNLITNQGPNANNQFQFLLSTCKEKPKISKELEDAQKVDKSLFIQELLISSIENFFRHDLKFSKNSDQKVMASDKNEQIDKPNEQNELKHSQLTSQSNDQTSQLNQSTTNTTTNQIANLVNQSNHTTEQQLNNQSNEPANESNEINNQFTQNDNKYNQELVACANEVDKRQDKLKNESTESNEPNNAEQSK